MTLLLPQLTPRELPADEVVRLEELYSLGLLDAESDVPFEKYTTLLQAALLLPMAAVVLVGRDVVHIKGPRGSGFQHVSRYESFAGHALLESEVFIVPDTHEDPRFVGHPDVVGGAKVRFYASALLRGPLGRPLGVVCVMDSRRRQPTDRELSILRGVADLVERDIAHAAAANALQQQSSARLHYDRLTGLAFEKKFIERLEPLAHEAMSQPLMLAVVQLDRVEAAFRAAGKAGVDHLAVESIRRLRAATGEASLMGCLREDMLCVAVPVAGSEDCEQVLQKLTEVFRPPFFLGDHRFLLRVRIGAAMSPDDADEPDKLLKRARTAVPKRQTQMTSVYRRYSPNLSARADRHVRLESALKRALDCEELRLAYQPKMAAGTHRLAGAEALLRWHSPDLGPVAPAELIPVAEQSGLSLELGAWVMREACRQLARWRDEGRKLTQISVNVSSYQLLQRDFLSQVRDVLATTGLAGENLNFEIVENSLIADIESAIEVMRHLRDIGIELSIDDFGKGFSSLSYLQTMPIRYLKIDREFMVNIPAQRRDRLLFESTVRTGRALGLVVVAEGIERREQADFAREVGCDQLQGFFFSPAIPADEFASRYL